MGRAAAAGLSGDTAGFTLMELMIALAIAGLLLAVAVPAANRLYDSMQYRAGVRDLVAALNRARYDAVNSGEYRDVTIDPQTNRIETRAESRSLPAGLSLTVYSARELNRNGSGVIRFYPEGGASGGGVDIRHPARGGVRITVDWLKGSVSQRPWAAEEAPGGA